jgi:hypothetical protein
MPKSIEERSTRRDLGQFVGHFVDFVLIQEFHFNSPPTDAHTM